MSDSTTPESAPSESGGMPRWLKWGALGLIGVVIVGYGLIFLYTKVINDSPDELDESDLDSALAIGTEAGADEQESVDSADEVEDPADTAAIETTTAPAEPDDTVPATEPPPAEETEGQPAGASLWQATDASELGYRVKEILFGVDTEGVGRTNQIEGALTISGTSVTDAEFVVDVASITSDESRRDGQFSGRIMSTDEFPTATFTLTEPIELGVEAVEGAEAATTATGELTLRGVTNPVTFDVTAKLENGKIGVLGNIPVVFADYEIANPSFGGITTEDNGLLEFVLVFEPVT